MLKWARMIFLDKIMSDLFMLQKFKKLKKIGFKLYKILCSNLDAYGELGMQTKDTNESS